MSNNTILGLENNNLIGTPILENTKILFKGKGNILFCDKNVHIVNTTIEFNGDNSIVYLKENKSHYILNLHVNNNCTFYMGANNYINGALNVIVSEETNVFIGNSGLFSFGIWVRTADPHLIYDVSTCMRRNYSKSIFIGDHVWIGQGAYMLKGSTIGSGSVIAAACVVSGKTVCSNSIFGGNPGKTIATDVFWDPKVVHNWTKDKTEIYSRDDSSRYVYTSNANGIDNFSNLDVQLKSCGSAHERMKILSEISKDKSKGRFAIKSDMGRCTTLYKKLLKKFIR